MASRSTKRISNKELSENINIGHELENIKLYLADISRKLDQIALRDPAPGASFIPGPIFPTPTRTVIAPAPPGSPFRMNPKQRNKKVSETEQMKKNVAAMLNNMIPPDIVNHMSPKLRKAFDGMLSNLAPPNDPIWDKDKPKVDPRDPNATFADIADSSVVVDQKNNRLSRDRDDMNHEDRVIDTLNRYSEMVGMVDKIVNQGEMLAVCGGCGHVIKENEHQEISDNNMTWHSSCLHEHLEMEQERGRKKIEEGEEEGEEEEGEGGDKGRDGKKPTGATDNWKN